MAKAKGEKWKQQRTHHVRRETCGLLLLRKASLLLEHGVEGERAPWELLLLLLWLWLLLLSHEKVAAVLHQKVLK